jgi:hypothetical protein
MKSDAAVALKIVAKKTPSKENASWSFSIQNLISRIERFSTTRPLLTYTMVEMNGLSYLHHLWLLRSSGCSDVSSFTGSEHENA